MSGFKKMKKSVLIESIINDLTDDKQTLSKLTKSRLDRIKVNINKLNKSELINIKILMAPFLPSLEDSIGFVSNLINIYFLNKKTAITPKKETKKELVSKLTKIYGQPIFNLYSVVELRRIEELYYLKGSELSKLANSRAVNLKTSSYTAFGFNIDRHFAFFDLFNFDRNFVWLNSNNLHSVWNVKIKNFG